MACGPCSTGSASSTARAASILPSPGAPRGARRLPDTGVPAAIRSVYSFRFLLAHLDRLRDPLERARWERLAESPPAGLTVAGRFGDSVAFELDAAPERSRRWERTFSTDLVVAHPRADVTIALAREDPEIAPSLDIALNRHQLGAGRPAVALEDLDSPCPRRTRRWTATCCRSSSPTGCGRRRRMAPVPDRRHRGPFAGRPGRHQRRQGAWLDRLHRGQRHGGRPQSPRLQRRGRRSALRRRRGA